MVKKKYKEFTLLEIFWIDSLHCSGWKTTDTYDFDERMLENSTVGYFVKNTNKTIYVVQSRSTDANESDKSHNIDAIMQIPWCSIFKIRKLK